MGRWGETGNMAYELDLKSQMQMGVTCRQGKSQAAGPRRQRGLGNYGEGGQKFTGGELKGEIGKSH